MAMIRIDNFGGLAPLHEPRQVPPPFGTEARNVRFLGGSLRSLELDSLVEFMPGPTVHLLSLPGGWLSWSVDYGVVHSAPSPIPQDPHRRIYWTQSGGTLGDAARVLAQPAPGPVTSSRLLGVIAPSAPPGFIEVPRLDTAIPSAMSNTSPITVTAVPHPFKEGQRVTVTFPPFPPAQGNINMREINGLEFIVGPVTSSTFVLRGSDGTRYSAFNQSNAPTIRRVYNDADLVTRSYVYTLVSAFGEEGPPSPPTDPADFRHDSSVRLTINTSAPDAYNPINRVRVYRAAAGADRAGFFFVKEAGVNPIGGHINVEVVDDITEDRINVPPGGGGTVTRVIGEMLPSTNWTAPPVGIRGLVQMPNGFLAAFRDNTLFFSEPYLPHAWPDRYRRTTMTNIRGIAVFGQTLVVATEDKPYIAYGTDPASVTLQELDIDAPCLLGASVCSIGAGVAYASHDGLIVISAGGAARNVTAPLFTKTQWISLFDQNFEAAFIDRRYVMLSRGGLSSWAIEMNNDRVDFAYVDSRGRALAVDRSNDQLNFVSFVPGDPPTANFRQRHVHAVGGPRAGTWSSGIYTLPRPADFSCGQVFASDYPVRLTVSRAVPTQAVPLGAAAATGQPPTAPNVSHTFEVLGPDPFRLPAAGVSREWRVRVETLGRAQVFEVQLAESMEELRRS